MRSAGKRFWLPLNENVIPVADCHGSSFFSSTRPEPPEPKLKIYFLPNLLTAGNLSVGLSLSRRSWRPICLRDFSKSRWPGFILLACIFDLFDGRVARMGGVEAPFGREFDPLADLISFGRGAGFLVHRVVLKAPFAPQLGWFIASIYLIWRRVPSGAV